MKITEISVSIFQTLDTLKEASNFFYSGSFTNKSPAKVSKRCFSGFFFGFFLKALTALKLN